MHHRTLIGVEAAAERMLFGIFPGPLPHRETGAGGLVRLVVLDRVHALHERLRQERHGKDRDQRHAAGNQEPVLGRAQIEHAQDRHTDEPGARLRPDRDERAGKDQRGRERHHAPVRREDGAVLRQPDHDRNDRYGHCGDDRAFEQAAVAVHKNAQRPVAAAAAHGLDTAIDDERAGGQHHDQRYCLYPQARAQGQRHEDREEQRLPDPAPLLRGILWIGRRDRRVAAIEQEHQQQPLPHGKTRIRFLVEDQPTHERRREGDQRYRHMRKKAPGDDLRLDDVDIEVEQQPHEGALEAGEQQGREKAGESQIKHRARPAAWSPPRHRDRRATATAIRRAQAARG